jgi:hypothetical protein
MGGHGEKLTRQHERALATLLSAPTIEGAAAAARVSGWTLRRWLRQPAFSRAYRQARRELVERAVGRMQAATGQAGDTLVAVAKDGKRDGDRVRAAVALLDHAFRGLTDADFLHAGGTPGDAAAMGTADVVQLLAARLRQVDAADLPTGERARLAGALADALLRAIAVDVLDKRTEALQAVPIGRKDKAG